MVGLRYICEKLFLRSRRDEKGATLVYRAECPRCGSYRIAQKLNTWRDRSY